MKRLLKFIAYIALSIVVLLVVAVIALKFFIDPNDYREQISEQASNAIGRDISIDGDLSLTFYPWLGIQIGQVNIGNAEGFEGPFAGVSDAGAAVELLPLILQRDIRVNRVLLDGLTANLQVNSNGQNNWTGIGKSDATQPADTTDSGASSIQSINVAAVEITNGKINYDDKQSGQRIEISNANLTASDIASGQLFNLDGGLLLGLPTQSASYQIDVDGAVRFDLDSGQLDFDAMTVSVEDQAAQPLPEVLLALTGGLNSQTESLNLSSLMLSADDLTVNGTLTGQQVLSNATINGQFALEPFNPSSVAAAFHQPLPELSDASVLQSFQGQLNLTMTPQQIQVQQLSASLDDTTLSGDLSMQLGDRPRYQFDLEVDSINLDRYLPKADEQAAQAEPTNTVSNIPVETFRSIDANGSFRVGSVIVNNLHADNIVVEFDANRNGWRFNPLSADFYDGSFAGTVSIDARGDSPILSTDDNISQVVTQAMLADMLGTDFVAGLALFDANISADINQPTTSLNGDVSFDIRDGAIKGVNIAQLLRQGFSIANSLTGGATASEEFLEGGGQTDFASLSGHFVANNGVIRNDDLNLLSPLLRLQGNGMVDLPNNRIDYTVTAALVQTLQGQGGDDLTNLVGKQIPIRITGTLEQPKYSVDPRAIVQILAGERVQKLKDSLLDKVGERLGGDGNSATGLLDGVLNNALGTKPQEGESESEATAEDEDNTSSTEEIGGALINSLFGRKNRQDDDDEDDDN